MLLGRELELVVSPKSAILAALEHSEGSSQALRELEAEYRSVLVKEERGEEIPRSITPAKTKVPPSSCWIPSC